jgi:hypothetical protein
MVGAKATVGLTLAAIGVALIAVAASASRHRSTGIVAEHRLEIAATGLSLLVTSATAYALSS